VLVSRLAVGAVIAALLVVAGIAVQRSIGYHPTYVERMNAQQRDLKKGPADGETKPR
jgi:outer membrane murein-binding lipoprotein Lpp